MEQNKKELKNSYKQRKIYGGICKITNTKSGKSLVFIAPNPVGAKNAFAFCQKTASCFKPVLQNDWEEHGANCFTFEILAKLEKREEQSFKDFKEELKLFEEMEKQNYPPNMLY